jgi:hypothetical protein
MSKLSFLAGLVIVGTLAGCSPAPEPAPLEPVPGFETAEPEPTPEDSHRRSLEIAEMYLSEQNGMTMVEKTEVIDGIVHVHVNRTVLSSPEIIEVIATLFYVYERERSTGPIDSLVQIHFADTGELAGQHQVDVASLMY